MKKHIIETRIPMKDCFVSQDMNPQNALDFNNHSCALCCVAMLTLAYGVSIEVNRLYEMAQKFKVYDPENIKIGAYHKPLATWLSHLFRRPCQAMQDIISEQELLDLILSNKIILASVTPEIRCYPQTPKKNKGHFILIYGIKFKRHHWWQLFQKPTWHIQFHDPAGIKKKNQQAVSIPVKIFLKYFSGRVVTLSIPPLP